MMEEEKLTTDRAVLNILRELMTIKCFTYNEWVKENLDKAMWGLVIDQLSKRRKTPGTGRNRRVFEKHRKREK